MFINHWTTFWKHHRPSTQLRKATEVCSYEDWRSEWGRSAKDPLCARLWADVINLFSNQFFPNEFFPTSFFPTIILDGFFLTSFFQRVFPDVFFLTSFSKPVFANKLFPTNFSWQVLMSIFQHTFAKSFVSDKYLEPTPCMKYLSTKFWFSWRGVGSSRSIFWQVFFQGTSYEDFAQILSIFWSYNCWEIILRLAFGWGSEGLCTIVTPATVSHQLPLDQGVQFSGLCTRTN